MLAVLLLCNDIMFASFHPSGMFPSCNDFFKIFVRGPFLLR